MFKLMLYKTVEDYPVLRRSDAKSINRRDTYIAKVIGYKGRVGVVSFVCIGFVSLISASLKGENGPYMIVMGYYHSFTDRHGNGAIISMADSSSTEEGNAASVNDNLAETRSDAAPNFLLVYTMDADLSSTKGIMIVFDDSESRVENAACLNIKFCQENTGTDNLIFPVYFCPTCRPTTILSRKLRLRLPARYRHAQLHVRSPEPDLCRESKG